MYTVPCWQTLPYDFLRDGSSSPSYFHHPETNETIEVPYFSIGTDENMDEKSRNIRNLQVSY